jgi:hypothetical protein
LLFHQDDDTGVEEEKEEEEELVIDGSGSSSLSPVAKWVSCRLSRIDWASPNSVKNNKRKRKNVTNEAGCGFQMVCIPCVFFAIAFSSLPHPCRAKQCPGCFLPYYTSSMSRAPPLGSTSALWN